MMYRQTSIYSMLTRSPASNSDKNDTAKELSYSDMLKRREEKHNLFDQLKKKLTAPQENSSPDSFLSVKTPSEKRERPSFALGSFSTQQDEDDGDDHTPLSFRNQSLSKSAVKAPQSKNPSAVGNKSFSTQEEEDVHTPLAFRRQNLSQSSINPPQLKNPSPLGIKSISAREGGHVDDHTPLAFRNQGLLQSSSKSPQLKNSSLLGNKSFSTKKEDDDDEHIPLVFRHQSLSHSSNKPPQPKNSSLLGNKRKFSSEVYDTAFEDRLNALQDDNAPDLSGPITPAVAASGTFFAKKILSPDSNVVKNLDLESGQASNKKLKLLGDLGDDCFEKKRGLEKGKYKHDFLDPSVMCDKKRRRPGDPLFDKRTVYIPKDVFSKMTASQKQYWETKSQYMDIVLFFKVGKFYELYELDAEIGQKEFDWKITEKGVGKCKQVGVPESGIEDAIQKLLARGYKVGRMEQIETSGQAKARGGSTATVERKLVQVLTPSTTIDDNLKREAVHLLALKEGLLVGDKNAVFAFGFAFVDSAACKFYVGSLSDDATCSSLGALLMQVSPQEVIFESGGLSKETHKALKKYSSLGCIPLELTSLQSGMDFIDHSTVPQLINSNDYFKLSDGTSWVEAIDKTVHRELAQTALGGLVVYLQRIKLDDDLLKHGSIFSYEVFKGFLRLDGQTMSNLEIFNNNDNGGREGTLLKHLDHCSTLFGKRLLRRWICHPLQNISEINRRLDTVDEFLSRPEIACVIAERLKRLPDLERLIARVKMSYSPSFIVLGPLLGRKKFKLRVKAISAALDGLRKAFELLKALQNGEQGPPKSNILLEASSLRCMSEMDAILLQMESRMTLLDNSRKEDNSPNEDEIEAFDSVATLFSQYMPNWSLIVDSISKVDVLLAFAISVNSSSGPTCRPTFFSAEAENVYLQRQDETSFLTMKGLWHPYAIGGNGGTPVPNDVDLGNDGNQECPRAMLLTGPNMGGKSTLLRATCLAVLMAQLGCYVPCDACVLSPVDIIFTRLGASDRIISGESTFLVECLEASSILRYSTENSLVVLDELGRGTSTFDGYAIAYAVFRHLVETKDCRLLFATHYHSLTKEFSSHPRVVLKHMQCSLKEQTDDDFFKKSITSSNNNNNLDAENQLIFLYKLRNGAAPESYGLQVALLAGMPKSVVVSAFDAGQAMKSCFARNFKSSELRAGFSSMHEGWLSTILSAADDIRNSNGLDSSIEDGYDTLLCIWHEMQRYSHRSFKQEE